MKLPALTSLVALSACGDSAKTPAAPIVVVDQPASRATWPTSTTDLDAGDDGGNAALGGARPTSSGRGRNVTLRQLPVTVKGKLAPDVVQRIVRPNFGKARDCYVEGLRSNASLTGTITVKFTIGRTGSVTKTAADETSDLPDKDVIACVVKLFASFSFPQPDSGEVEVIYPIVFYPPEED